MEDIHASEKQGEMTDSSTPQTEQNTHRCVICLDDIPLSDEENSEMVADKTEDSAIYRSRCGHITHTSCLHNSIRSGNYNCPSCRQPLGDISVEMAKVDARLNRYVRMLKSGLAAAAVRQRMIVDALPLVLIDAFFTGGASRVLTDESESNAMNEANMQEIMDKYRKMLNMGMPEGAVRQKMIAAGLSQDIVNAVF